MNQRGTGIDYEALFAGIPTSYLVMSPVAPDYLILDANAAYLANVGRSLEDIVGRPVFEAFPPPPDALDESGVPWIRLSFDKAVATKRPDTMPLQKYDVPDSSGGLVERYWSLISVPLVGDDGEVALLVQRAENITDFVHEQRRGELEREQSEQWRRRVEEIEGDLYARAQELQAAITAKEAASRRLASLAEVTLQLSSAESVTDMAAIVSKAALPVLGASWGSIAVRRPGEDLLDVSITASVGEEIPQAGGVLALQSPLPTALAARGALVLVPTPRTAEGYEGLPEAFRETRVAACAAIPMQLGPRLLGAVTLGFTETQAFVPEEVELLRAFAAQCATVLDRLQVRQAERRAAAEVQHIAETLQRSLLTEPPASQHLRFAVRYMPAQQVAQVGGDWYDAFRLAEGSTVIVIGDVAGHDQDAAATMAQVRNMLRGITQILPETPAAILDALDGALAELQLGVLATVVLAKISPPSVGGSRTLTWCNAGHPPPVIIRAYGAVEMLHRAPDVLVGLAKAQLRTNHEIALDVGDTVLLYTDGLVEIRGGDIEEDLLRLQNRVAGHDPSSGPEALLHHLVGSQSAFPDDVALLAVQTL